MSIEPISGSLGLIPAQSSVSGSQGGASPAAAGRSAAAGEIHAAGELQPPTSPQAVQDDRSTGDDKRSALRDAVQRANETVQVLRSNLQFTVDEATGIDVVKFIDIKTKEVIRQIPSEEMLALARRLDEIKGLLIKDKA